jgi:hypothetical protein
MQRMNSATAVEAPETKETPEETPPTDQSAAKIFRYSDWVHIGPDAEECAHAQDGKCSNADHFHAWIRLPNKFQITAIREKAQAARARVMRQAKEEDSDRRAIIDNQLAEAQSAGREVMIEELTAKNTFKWTQRAMSELAEDSDDGEEESEFAHVEEDQQRWVELNATPAEDRDEAEYKELTAHMEKWNDAVDAKFAELAEPEKEALEGRTDEELIELLREQVVAEQSNQIFMRVYNAWEYVVCTMTPNSKGGWEQVFPSLSAMEAAAPEIVGTLEGAYNALEQELNERSALRAEGN